MIQTSFTVKIFTLKLNNILMNDTAIIDSIPNFVDLPSLNNIGFKSLYNDSDSIHSKNIYIQALLHAVCFIRDGL